MTWYRHPQGVELPALTFWQLHTCRECGLALRYWTPDTGPVTGCMDEDHVLELFAAHLASFHGAVL